MLQQGKQAIFKNCPPFADWITEINNTQVDNAKYLDVAISMFNLTESESFKFLDNTNNAGIKIQK